MALTRVKAERRQAGANSSLILIFALLLLGILTLVAVNGGPQQEAVRFLEVLQSGNLSQAVAHFNVHNCRCVPKGGFASYLVYQSGQEPNLAFLIGHKFQIGNPKVIPLNAKPNDWPFLPQTEEAVVNVSLLFDPKQYSPVLLPLPLAYGTNMTLYEFKKFVDDPTVGIGRALTLRLRKGLESGSIEAGLEKVSPETRSRFSFLDSAPAPFQKAAKGKEAATVGVTAVDALLQAALKAHPDKHMIPQEAGQVIRADRTVVPRDALESQLPRLQSITLTLALSRSSLLHSWYIYRLSTSSPVFTQKGGTHTVDLSRAGSAKPGYEP